MHPGIHASERPNKAAYIMARDGQIITYDELNQDSNRIAHWLRAQGLQPGDGIALLMENHPWFFKVIWAAQRSGLYFTPISTRFQTEEVAYILDNCDAKMLFTTAAKWPLVQQVLEQGLPQESGLQHCLVADTIELPEKTGQCFISLLQDDIAQMPTTAIDDEMEGADMFYSSGTTGRPKGVRMPLTKAPLGEVNHIVKIRLQLHRLHSEMVYLSPAPLYHSAPVRYNLMTHRMGGTSIIMDRFDAQWALQLIGQYRVTHAQWVPTMFVRMLKLPKEVRQQYDLASLEMALHAAAPCPQQVKEQMIDWWGPIIHEYYSGTEANGATAISSQEWLQHKGSVGRPITGAIHILDEAGNELPQGQTGLVYFEGGLDFQYHKDPEKTAKAKTEQGWSTLGDIGYLDEEGFLYLTDRKDFTIISGGVNIYPQEIENLLVTHPKVADVAVFGVPNEEFGEEVKAVVQPLDWSEAGESLETELIGFCREHLAHLKCPKSVDFDRELPRHPTGKLYKKQLRARYWPKD